MKSVPSRIPRIFFRLACLAGLLAVLSSAAAAQTTSAALLGMFPKEMSDFGYADLKTARSYPWFDQMEKQLLPNDLLSFEKFATSTALTPNSELDEIYWGETAIPSAGEQVLGVALGQYDVTATEDHLNTLKVPEVDYQGFQLYAFGSGINATDLMFFFIDSNTAAFGQRAALQRLIDVRTGVADSFLQNDSLYPVVSASSSDALLWAVLDSSTAQKALQDFLPEASQFPQLTAVRDHMKALIIRLDKPFSTSGDQLNVTFQAVCGSPDDANLIAAAIQVALMYRRNQSTAGSTGVASILDQARVTPRGDILELRLSINQDQILALIVASAPPPQ